MIPELPQSFAACRIDPDFSRFFSRCVRKRSTEPPEGWNSFNEPYDAHTDTDPEHGPAQDVEGIVNAYINTGISHQYREQIGERSGRRIDEAHDRRFRKNIDGMGRRK